jgi:hypothetical protein
LIKSSSTSPFVVLTVILVGLALILPGGLIAIRVLDGQRDQRDAVLVSLMQLNSLFSEQDAVAAIPPGDRPPARLQQLAYSTEQISERLPYLRRQGLPGRQVAALQGYLARYRADALTTNGSPSLPATEARMAQDSQTFLSFLTGLIHSYRSGYAEWDQAVDVTTIAVLAAGSVLAVAGAVFGLVLLAGRRPRNGAAS